TCSCGWASPSGRSRETVKAELLAIGSELLGPLRAETNSLWLTERLLDAGIEVSARATLADDAALLESAFRVALARADVVIATGGLGPTADDLTREAPAAAPPRSPKPGGGAGADRRRPHARGARRRHLAKPEAGRGDRGRPARALRALRAADVRHQPAAGGRDRRSRGAAEAPRPRAGPGARAP